MARRSRRRTPVAATTPRRRSRGPGYRPGQSLWRWCRRPGRSRRALHPLGRQRHRADRHRQRQGRRAVRWPGECELRRRSCLPRALPAAWLRRAPLPLHGLRPVQKARPFPGDAGAASGRRDREGHDRAGAAGGHLHRLTVSPAGRQSRPDWRDKLLVGRMTRRTRAVGTAEHGRLTQACAVPGRCGRPAGCSLGQDVPGPRSCPGSGPSALEPGDCRRVPVTGQSP